MHHFSLANRDKFYYLASPYTHPNSFVMAYRYLAVMYTGAELTRQGYKLIEPITSCAIQGTIFNLPHGYEYWQSRDRGLIDRSDGTIVLTLPGWLDSIGVQDEIKYSYSIGKPVYYIDPSEILTDEIRKELY